LSDESLETGGRSARKAVEEAGFSDELKARLQEKIANASFKGENASAFAQANLPTYAGRGTADIAGSTPWVGTESIEDASLRMLNDAYKPMRAPPRLPGVHGPPKRVDTGQKASSKNASAAKGTRLANARDKTSHYAFLKDPNLSEEERAKFREEMKQRFQPGARAVPATIQGLASLANERIEDAIARGQFKNIKGRGQKVERDYNASNPFLDTTEYFMNKIIQKQEIVPPWIEKQQELVQTATRFRSQLRANWRRHVARSIAARGGGLQSHMRMAEQYALAEAVYNPTKRKEEKFSTVGSEGQISQITLAGELKPSPVAGHVASSDDLERGEQEIKVLEQIFNDDGTVKTKQPDEQMIITTEQPSSPAPEQSESHYQRPSVQPFRDPQWEETERSYHRIAVENLNSITRSYNLMAPDLAKKPYFSLERELKSCFADVAPTVAPAIRERALAPKVKGVEIVGHTKGGVMERFDLKRGYVHDEDIKTKGYGFKQFWKDLFS
ncbi:hypothetical protein K431DRAFT_213480, partial [Polychaeton citri CBS 116435]